MQNYAEKELREALSYLEQARNTYESLRAIQRALELGRPVEVSFRTAGHNVTALCPAKGGEKMLEKLSQQAFERVHKLEEQEVYWCKEVAAVARQEQINAMLQADPDLSRSELEAEHRQNTLNRWAAHDKYMANERGPANVAEQAAPGNPSAPPAVE